MIPPFCRFLFKGYDTSSIDWDNPDPADLWATIARGYNSRDPRVLSWIHATFTDTELTRLVIEHRGKYLDADARIAVRKRLGLTPEQLPDRFPEFHYSWRG